MPALLLTIRLLSTTFPSVTEFEPESVLAGGLRDMTKSLSSLTDPFLKAEAIGDILPWKNPNLPNSVS